MTRTVDPIRTTALDRLRDAVELRRLDALDAVEYAAGHALFEDRSDQRGRLTDWLVRHTADRIDRPTRVLSIGCGDGTVDARVAAGLAALGHRVDWTGVEPHRPSGRAFVDRLIAITDVHPVVLSSPFAQSHPSGGYDLVLAVHSLYYVDDLAATLSRALGLLGPGGELIVLHAPLEPVNALVRVLAPGRPQRFSDEVLAELHVLDAPAEVVRIDNRLDLTASGDPRADLRIVSFAVQAVVPATLERTVRAALAERALPGPGLVLPHPVDAIVVRT